jgi:hypothetical protein
MREGLGDQGLIGEFLSQNPLDLVQNVFIHLTENHTRIRYPSGYPTYPASR